MKNKIYISLVCFVFICVLSGCVSISRSPSPRFYRLSAAEEDGASKLKIANEVIIGVGPVKITEYLNRPHIVTVDNNNMVSFAQFDRWAEPLDLAMARVLNENLTIIFEGNSIEMYPWNMFIPVRFQVVLDVIELKANLKKDMTFVVQWSIVDLKNKNSVFNKRSVLKEAIKPSNYSGVASALSVSLSRLSNEIAQELSQLSASGKQQQHQGAVP